MSQRKAIAAAIRHLKGTWKSDRAKTESRWVFPKKMAQRRFKTWKTIFGKARWRFTQTHLYAEYEGHRTVAAYKVLWADECSAVLLIHGADRDRIHHVHFDDRWIYLLAARDIVEYFKRVD